MRTTRQENPEPDRRRGFILAVVTIIVILLTFAAYNYSTTMLDEYQAAANGGRDIVSRTAAESAIEFAATRVMERDLDDTINLFHDPDVFRSQLLIDSPQARGRVRFSVLSFNETSDGSSLPRFGLASENAKFNLNKLLEIDQVEEGLPDDEKLGLAYMVMSNIPNMTEDVVDAILDWLDSDEDRRPGGAEGDDYASLAVSYECKNGLMDNIEELLKVQGVTPQLYYGEDRNHNGMLDEGEDANDDGILDLGWKAYFTVDSRERNTTPDGLEKINLNGGELTELFDAVEEEFGVDAAKFIVGYRLAGTDYATPLPGEQQGVDGMISRENIDLTVVPKYQFRSIYDLIGGETGDVKMLDGTTEIFTSPWPEDASTLLNTFPDLEKAFTTTDDAFVEGRININQARREVLLTIPGGETMPVMTEIAADAIISSRPAIEIESASSNVLALRKTAAWILAEGVVDLPALREIGPYITVGGDVYRFQAIGHYDEDHPTTRLEATIDATVYPDPPRIMSVRDLSSLGPGFHPKQLGVTGESE